MTDQQQGFPEYRYGTGVICTTSSGVRCRVIATGTVVGDVGWRWGRWRALRFANKMDRSRMLVAGAHSHRFAVQPLGWGRWRVVALQNGPRVDLRRDH